MTCVRALQEVEYETKLSELIVRFVEENPAQTEPFLSLWYSSGNLGDKCVVSSYWYYATQIDFDIRLCADAVGS